MSLRTVAAVVPGLALGLTFTAAWGPTETSLEATELAAVVEAIERLNELRSGLAGAFSGEPDRATFAQVCKPVGQKAKRLAEENGWKVQQLALKYRNPAHRLDPQAERVYGMMLEDANVMGLWVRSEMDGREGVRYFRRIVVEEACLACHGAKEERPDFIKQGYPADRAYGFEVGDLRGLYSVFIGEG